MTNLIEQGLAIAKAATKGPWNTNAVPHLGSTANGVFTKPASDEDPEMFICSVKPRWDEGCIVGDEAIANAEFIAFAGTHLKTILEALQSAEAERTALLSRLDALAGEWRNRDDGMYGQVWSEAAEELLKLKEPTQ